MGSLREPALTEQELAEFHANGYVRLGKVAPDAEIEAIGQRIDDIMLGKISMTIC